jgi:hypothetical protein
VAGTLGELLYAAKAEAVVSEEDWAGLIQSIAAGDQHALGELYDTDVLRPSVPLRERLAQRLAAETGEQPPLAAPHGWVEPEWQEVAPGISCQLLATDWDRDRVSMLVRLGPGVDYPPHRHAGLEELHLLDGELVVDDKKLYPGDYLRAEAGTADARVWTETGCTCVLMTSIRDELH